MTTTETAGSGPLQFLWFFPTSGDVRFFGSPEGQRTSDNKYLRVMAQALDSLGYYGALLPTGSFCEDAWIVASSLVTHTERLRYLVALRPGSIVPAESARQASAFDRLSGGRLLLNVVTGGVAGDMHGDGNFLEHDERYQQTREFLHIWRAMMRGEKVDFSGKHFRCKDARMIFPPVQDPYPPLYFGGAKMVQKSARRSQRASSAAPTQRAPRSIFRRRGVRASTRRSIQRIRSSTATRLSAISVSGMRSKTRGSAWPSSSSAAVRGFRASSGTASRNRGRAASAASSVTSASGVSSRRLAQASKRRASR